MKKIKLYNMILPPFMLFTITPFWWFISMSGNFIIDSAVLLITLFIFKKISFGVYKKTIFKVWIWGYVADLMGAAYLFIMSEITFFIRNGLELFIGENPNNLLWRILDGITLAANFSEFDSIWGVLFMISGIIVASIFIFIFNYIYIFKKYLNDILTKKQMIIISLTIAIATAPYTFLLPGDLLN